MGCDNDKTTNEIVFMLSNYNILNDSNDNDIHEETEQCMNDDSDDSMLFKDTLIEQIEQASDEVILQEPTLESDDSEFEIGLDEVEVDQRDVIFKLLESVIDLDFNTSELKDSPYSSSNYVNQAKGAFFTFRRILQNG